MKINRNSWHYKFASIFTDELHYSKSTDICQYSWILLTGLGKGFLLVAMSVLFFTICTLCIVLPVGAIVHIVMHGYKSGIPDPWGCGVLMLAYYFFLLMVYATYKLHKLTYVVWPNLRRWWDKICIRIDLE